MNRTQSNFNEQSVSTVIGHYIHILFKPLFLRPCSSEQWTAAADRVGHRGMRGPGYGIQEVLYLVLAKAKLLIK